MQFYQRFNCIYMDHIIVDFHVRAISKWTHALKSLTLAVFPSPTRHRYRTRSNDDMQSHMLSCHYALVDVQYTSEIKRSGRRLVGIPWNITTLKYYVSYIHVHVQIHMSSTVEEQHKSLKSLRYLMNYKSTSTQWGKLSRVCGYP